MEKQKIGPYKTWKVEGKVLLIKANPNKGFNFDYTIYIPNTVKNETTLIVEGTNIGSAKGLNNEEQLNYILEYAINPGIKGNPIYEISTSLGMPLLFPIFPRWGNDEEPIYNHMLLSNSLNHNTSMLEELGLKRVDLQLIQMIEDAKQILKEKGIKVDEKIIISGFLASAKFVNRFTLLHPEHIKLAVAGGVTGALTLPIKEINGEKLLWPVGIGNISELIGEDTFIDIDAFKKVRQFYYMGMEDKNDPYSLKPNTPKNKYIPDNPGIIKSNELKQLYTYLGENETEDRWQRTMIFYEELGINVHFESYEGVGHNPHIATKDIQNEIEVITNQAKKQNSK